MLNEGSDLKSKHWHDDVLGGFAPRLKFPDGQGATSTSTLSPTVTLSHQTWGSLLSAFAFLCVLRRLSSSAGVARSLRCCSSGHRVGWPRWRTSGSPSSRTGAKSLDWHLQCVVAQLPNHRAVRKPLTQTLGQRDEEAHGLRGVSLTMSQLSSMRQTFEP